MAINPLGGPGNHLQPFSTLPTPQTTTHKQQLTDSTVKPVSETKVNSQPGTPESDEHVKQAVEKIQNNINKLAQNLQFSIDEDTGKTVVKVLDAQTQEIIRQFPTEEAILIARALDKVQGLLFNDKA